MKRFLKINDPAVLHLGGDSFFIRATLFLLVNLSGALFGHRIPLLGFIPRKVLALSTAYASEKNFFGKEHNVDSPTIAERRIQPIRGNLFNSKDFYDLVVIGTGPGAAMVAGLIPDGCRTLFIEKGQIQRTNYVSHHTLKHVKQDFNKRGREFIVARGFPQFTQASILGGGSELNSGLYHELPDVRRSEFLEKLGVSASEYEINETFVRSLLDSKVAQHSIEKSVIARGAKNLGLEFRNVPRWRHYDPELSLVIQSGMEKLVWSKYLNLKDKSEKRIDVRMMSKVIRIMDVGRNLCLELESGERLFSERVVLAGGTTSTAKLIGKSKLVKWRDFDFQWHPMIRVVCECARNDLGFLDVDPFQAWDKSQSIKFGSGASSPGLTSLALGKFISNTHANVLRTFYASISSSGKGGFIPGSEVPYYLFSNLDKILLNEASELLNELTRAAGVKIISNTYVESKSLSTVHIFGSVPAGRNTYISGTNSLVSDPRIMVADGSLLPFGPGVNPQAIIMSTVRTLMTNSIKLW